MNNNVPVEYGPLFKEDICIRRLIRTFKPVIPYGTAWGHCLAALSGGTVWRHMCLLPVQLSPFPVKPDIHLQENDPIEFSQSAY